MPEVGLGIFGTPFFTDVILPFLLVLVVTYAILERTRVLSERKEINVMTALLVAFFFIVFPSITGVITRLIPIIAVILIILFAFILLFAFVIPAGKGGLIKGLQIAFSIVLGIALIISVLWATGVFTAFKIPPLSEQAISTIVLVALIIGIMAVLLSVPSPAAKEKGAG